ncbi:MAG: sulfatase [Verrucomicrobia bacterium]|nr:sulfatase [Verrucomicrobiota bacterium]
MSTLASHLPLIVFAALALSASAATRPPNFILINCDDLGCGDIGPFGSTRIKTPHLDRMAAEGMKLVDFHVTAGMCTPSRASLMTGCYPKRVGMHLGAGGGWVLFPGNARGLHTDERTIAEVLKPRGYATALIGKWHLGDQPEFLPTRQGFDVFFGIPFSNDMGQMTNQGRTRTNAPPTPLMRGSEVIELEPDQRQLTRRYTGEAIRFIEASRAQPFFLYFAHSMPHWPQFASDDFAGKSRQGRYGDSVEEIDWSTGQILARLKALDLDADTFVLFTSDNGGPIPRGASNGPLRAGKGTTWEGGFRVPCLARWPGKIPAGSVCRELAVTMDVLPTFAKLAGAEVPADRIIDGKDIWPLLAGQPGAKTPHEAFFHYHLGQLQAVRSGDWKLILPHAAWPDASAPNQVTLKQPELYNLAADIGESKDVAAQHPDVAQRLMRLAEQCREDLGDDSLKLAGKHCREPGHVKRARTLTPVPPRPK